MAVYYKFKSAKDYDSVSLDGHFITVASLKDKIFQNKHLGSGTDFDLVVINAQTNEEYVDEGMLIPKNTSVLIRRVPGRPRMPIVAAAPVTDQQEPEVECKAEDLQGAKSTFFGANLSVTNYPEDSEWDEFGNDLYAIPEILPVQASNQVQDAPPPSKADEDSKIQALIDTPALDWQHQTADGFGNGRGYGRGMGGRMGGRGFGRGVGLDRKTPPPGYVCHRCKVPGHFIQHCPTNGDPTFDIRKVKPPTGIPKSMLVATPDGSYALPSGAVAVLKPNEAAFEKEIEGMPSTRSVGDLPPELYCPLCKEVMKDAVLTSKCCFRSFCDKCIRDNIISKSMCVCGAHNVLADDLLPNNTVRDTINRILEANNSSGDNKGSAFHIQDMESARPKPNIPSPALSAASKGEQVLSQNKDTTGLQDTTQPVKIVDVPLPQPPVQNLDIAGTARVPDVSEATNESRNVKGPALQASGPLASEDQPQKLVPEPGKKKKKKKPRMPSEMQWNASQEFAAENYMMPTGPAFNPYWSGMQPGMEGFGGPFTGPMPYMGYGPGPMPMDFPYGGHFPQDPYGPPVNMMPFPPQRNFAGYGMGYNSRPPVMSKEEFEARKADLMRKREVERHGDSRDLPKEREPREVTSSSGVPSIKSQSVCASIVHDCFFFRFLCHLAGALVNEGLSFIGGKEGKLGKELIYVLSFGDIKMNYILSPLSAFMLLFSSQAKLLLLKIRVANVDEVFSSTLDAQIDFQNSTRTQLKFAGYLLDWLTLNVFSCFFLSIVCGCTFCYFMFKLNSGVEIVANLQFLEKCVLVHNRYCAVQTETGGWAVSFLFRYCTGTWETII